jgi:hypothetical protein
MPSPGNVTTPPLQQNPFEQLGSKIATTVGNMPTGQLLQNAGVLGTSAIGQHMINNPTQTQTATAQGPTLYPTLAAAQLPSQQQPLSSAGGMAHGGILNAKGGRVALNDGAYIIPADVVSALGNGSTKAGGEFLNRLLESVKGEAVKRQGLGAVHKS